MIRRPLTALTGSFHRTAGSLRGVTAAVFLGLFSSVMAQTELPSPDLPPTDVSVPSAASVPTAIPTEQPKIVRSVDVRSIGAGTIDKNRVLANMSLQPGTTYTQDKSDQDVKNLVASGIVANVNIIPEPAGADGVRLTVIVEARTNLGEVVFLGNSSIPTKTLASEADLKLGTVVDEVKLQEAQRKVREAYEKKGFTDVDVRYQQEKAAETGFTRVTFYITEGQRSVLNDVRFEGNSVYTEKELVGLVKIGSRDWWRVWDLKKRVNAEQLEKDVLAIQDKYQNNGYMNARVTAVDRVPVGDKVDVVFRVSEGESFTFSAVGIEGMTSFPKEELVPSLQSTAGETYSAAGVKADLRLIRDYYGSRGYADVMVTPRITRSGGGQLAITYVVTEGGIYYVRKINIDGNTKTKDEVIRREVAIAPGEVYSTTKQDVSKARLEDLGYFQRPVEFFPVDTDTPGYKDVNITVSEVSTGQVQIGAGFSSIDSLIGILELQQTNFDLMNWPSFTGDGQKFRTRIQYGLKRRDFQLEFSEPWFMDQRLAFGTELYYRDLLYLSDYYDQNVYGAAFSLARPLGEHGRIRAEYRVQNVGIDVDDDASEILQTEDGDYLDSAVGLAYTYDTRSPLRGLTRKGHKFQIDGAVSGLGGDVETYEFGLSGSKYFSLPWDTVFKVEGAFETVDNWGGDSTPIFKRKFLGGANTLRGFDYRDVGPKDENGEPIGGKTSAYITAEYNFPLFWKLRGTVFADVGMVSSDVFDVGGDWNSDVGFGLQLWDVLPQGPIRVDIGFPISSDEYNDDGVQFNFNIGYQF